MGSTKGKAPAAARRRTRAGKAASKKTAPKKTNSKALSPKGSPGPSAARGRGRLVPMRSTDGFRAFVLEQLAGVRELHARAMFGGIGLYAGDVFFGIIAADTLYLKVDGTNRTAYERAGSEALRPYADRPMTMPYYNVPLSVLEDADTLAAWATKAIAVARAKKAGKKR